jgi:hypothetical protein
VKERGKGGSGLLGGVLVRSACGVFRIMHLGSRYKAATYEMIAGVRIDEDS